MAVAATHLTSGANATNGASYDTASVTPSADALVLVWVSGTGTNSTTAPTVTGNGLTYVLVTEVHSGGNAINEYLYRAMGTPSAGALNISWTAGNVTGCNWSVAEFTGVDTSGTDGSGAVAETAVANANATAVTVTLADVAAGNASAGGFATADDIAITPGTGYTELGEAMHNNPGTTIQSEWRSDGSTTVDASWATAQNSVGIGVEIAAASSGTPIAPALEADAAQPLTRVKRRAAAPAVEADEAQPLVRRKHRAVTPATETDTAVPLTASGPSGGPITPATETDTAVPVGRTKRRSLTPVVEAGQAVPLLRHKRLVIAPATETDVAQPFGQAGYHPTRPSVSLQPVEGDAELQPVAGHAAFTTVPEGDADLQPVAGAASLAPATGAASLE